MRKKTGLMMGVLFTFHFSFCAVINIPSDQAAIQAGIDVSADGDTVLVQPGTYIENINFNGKNITLGSMFIMTGDTGVISQTVIDGNQNGSVVTFESGEDSTTIFTGFTVRNGNGFENSGWSDEDHVDYWSYGGGIYCCGADPVLKNLIVRDNLVYFGWEAGIPGRGGGIYLCESNSFLDHVSVKNNSAGEGDGGGLFIIEGNPVLQYITIIENESNIGGGIAAKDCNPVIRRSLISRNHTESSGGGIWLRNTHCTLEQITITENETNGYAGGLSLTDDAQVFMKNSIIWQNQQEEIRFADQWNPNYLEIAFTDLEGGIEGISYNGNGEISWLDGNMDADPLFLDPEINDYRLQPDSPCIDAGDPDLDGDGIPWENDPDDRDPDGTRLDIGAYYFHQSAGCPVPGDVSGDNLVNVLDIVQTVNCILDDAGSCSCADLNSDGLINVMDILLMIEIILGE